MKKIILLVLSLLIIGTGCFVFFIFDKGESEQIDKGKEEEKVEKKVEIIDINSKTRPYAVMINNNHDAWPHIGLGDAYLNYEIIVEGGITRILSLFKDEDVTQIGSVRSSRHYYLDYAMESDAIYVHHGRSPQANIDLSKYEIDNVDGMYDAKAFFRDKTYNSIYEHTSFSYTSGIESVINSKGYETESDETILFNYSGELVDLSKKIDSVKADKIEIEYSNYQTTYYEFDSETGLYIRYMDDYKHDDGVTGENFSAKNIITYQVYNYTIAGDDKGRQDLKNIGSGEGYYISNGYSVPIKWSKSSRESKTIYTYMDGTEIVLNDGVTWVQIQPEGKNLDISEYTE